MILRAVAAAVVAAGVQGGAITGELETTSAGRLRVLTLNVWHGLRSGESKTRFPGEDTERKRRRFDWQISEIERLGPDVLLLQEVNPNQRQSAEYARALGYDEIHKVTSCGFHLPPIKIPSNVNDGLAILARPGLGLRRVGKKRLSGNAHCAATFGFQTKESRYALLGEIAVEGRKVLLATTHLSSPPFVPPGFEDGLERLVSSGALEPAQYDEIVERLGSKRERNLAEVRTALAEIDEHRGRISSSGEPAPVILGGDFNTEPSTAAVRAVLDHGMKQAGSGAGFLTWDPVRNHENYAIGSRRAPPLPTYELPELEELLASRRTTARQIDFIFVSEEVEIVSAEMVLDRDRGGLFPSDHFGVLAVIDLKR
jgi:endonuclease/exonuclease/phosphatase family metal-dependent hydrolase